MSAEPLAPRRSVPRWLSILGWLVVLVALLAGRTMLRQYQRDHAAATRARQAQEARARATPGPGEKVNTDYILGAFDATPSPSPDATPTNPNP